jgi:hypothetical protein
MFDANGNPVATVGELTAVYAVLAGVGLILLVAIVATFFPRHWG